MLSGVSLLTMFYASVYVGTAISVLKPTMTANISSKIHFFFKKIPSLSVRRVSVDAFQEKYLSQISLIFDR